MRKVCAVTGSRADYGLLYWLMKEIQADDQLDLQLIVTGMHLSSDFGLTKKIIEEDDFKISKEIKMLCSSDSTCAITKTVGQAIIGFADAFLELSPDVVVILGDRFEILAASIAATLARIPVAHIHGGESTIGAFDESIRHAITKMSLLHFTAAEPYRRRVIQMGESPARVFCVGAPGVENIKRFRLMNQSDLEKSINFSLSRPTFLVTYHPVTLEDRTSQKHLQELLAALSVFPDAKIIFTGTNSDPDHKIIPHLIYSFVAERKNTIFIQSLGQIRYLSTLKYIDVMIGNSSSGIIEVPTFKKPTVNIGDRQKGRVMAASVINCENDAKGIRMAINQALSKDFQDKLLSVNNPYAGENTSMKIKNILKGYPLNRDTLKKEFYDYVS